MTQEERRTMGVPKSPMSFDPDAGRLLRPAFGHRTTRHIRLGVSHASGDPARHRTFEIRAAYDASRAGWVASLGEQNLNDQRGAWTPVPGDPAAAAYATAAACLGAAVTLVLLTVVQELERDP
jgi:hypothetical protein